MKLYHIIKSSLIIALLFMFVGCNDDKPAEIIKEVKEITKLELSGDYVKIKEDEKATIDIKQGEEDYKVFSLNSDIAKVEFVDKQIVITGVKKGLTNIIVSDKESQYQQVRVAVYQGDLTVDKDDFDVLLRLGHQKNETIEILTGNDGYTVSSNNEEVVSARIAGNTISLIFKKAGEAKIKVKDMLDFEKEISVKVTSTTVPFSKEELEEIMAQNNVRFLYNSQNVTPDNYGYTFYNSEEDGEYLYGWNYYNYYYLKIWFSGGKNVGKKEGSRMTYNHWSSPLLNNQPIDFEIIKNDGTLIWAVFSFIEEEKKLNYGYFIQKINP